jgi:hypothetical protein
LVGLLEGADSSGVRGGQRGECLVRAFPDESVLTHLTEPARR